ncbi:MAG TPA: hypothetical protein VF824_10255 [Thermoanaerobaculia bacterium]|jgi:hypothetical protein
MSVATQGLVVRTDVAVEVRERGAMRFHRIDDAPRPAVILVSGYPDAGFERVVGVPFREMQSVRDWARLIAAAGCVAVTYTNEEPLRDLCAVADEVLREHERVALFATSGNVPVALAMLSERRFRCAAFCYGYLTDRDGSTAVAEASKSFGFVNPAAGDVPADVPLFLARAGADACPGLNATLDRFVIDALHRNLPIALANHPSGPHAFDLFDDSDASRAIVRQLLAFLSAWLLD